MHNASEKPQSSIHKGHRQRMMDTYLQNGISAFSDYELLEFLLTFSIPRSDTNPLAHRLIDRFGGLYQVFETSVDQLMTVPGIGRRSAVLIHFTGRCWNRSEQSRLQDERYFRTTRACGEYFVARLGAYREERVYLMSLNANCRLLDCREICRGSVNKANVPLRLLVEIALTTNASSVILAHNHPSGMLLPSQDDIVYTEDAYHALQLVDVVLADHFIVAEREFSSMKDSGFMNFGTLHV